jgi:hypothetical protein
MSQMGIKPRRILHQHWDTCPIVLPVRRNPQHRSSWLLSQPLPHLVGHHLHFWTSLREFHDLVVNPFTRQTPPTINKNIFYEYRLHWVLLRTKKKTHNRKLLFRSKLLRYGCHFDYWNHVRVCYLDSHEAGLCYYLVLHIENPLHPLQLFQFYLWPIYWLSLIITWNLLLISVNICPGICLERLGKTSKISVSIVGLWSQAFRMRSSVK